MTCVKVKITKVLDDPEFIEFELTDIHAKTHRFMDKVPVICDYYDYSPTHAIISPEGKMGCKIIKETETSYIIDTELPWDIESYEGEYRFEVRKEQVTDL